MLKTMATLAMAFYLSQTNGRATVQVNPRGGFGPLGVHVRMIVERDRANRLAVVIVDGENFYRSTDVQIDGDSGPRVGDYTYLLPAGEYRIAVELHTNDGRTPVTASVPLTVQGVN